jgi:hypothetical protein
MCQSEAQADAAQELARKVLADLGWSCTGRRRRSLTSPKAGKVLIFLDCHFHARVSASCWSAASAATTFRAAVRFNQIDRYVLGRLRGLMRKRYGRNLRPGHWKTWTREWFEAQGLYRRRGTVRYPVTAS